MLHLPLALIALGALAAGQDPVDAPVVLGADDHRFEWLDGWLKLPEGATDIGNTHGCVLVDSKGRLYFNTDTERAVMIYDADGNYLSSWGKDYAGGMHGMVLVREGEREFLYLAHTGRHEVVKATLDGEVIWTLGYPEASGLYDGPDRYRPTSVAVAPDGDIFVADGYGLSWIHQYGKDRKYKRSFGGPGSEPGKLKTPHGIVIDTRGEEPVLLVADRENHRLQTFSLEGKPIAVIEGMLRRPCHVHERDGILVVADLAGRITLLDEKNELIAHLGENSDSSKWAKNPIPKDQWSVGEFISPHCATWDADGNLYVLDWNRWGRITKLARRK